MSMQHWRSDTDRRELKYRKKTLFKCHIFDKKTSLVGRPGIEAGHLQSENLKGRRHLLDLGMGGRVMLIRIFSRRENMNYIPSGWDRVYFRDLVTWKMHMRVP